MKRNLGIKEKQLNEQNRMTEEMHDYYREFHDTKHCFTSTEIAKDYGLSAQTFHQTLHSLGILYPVNDTWQLYSEIAGYGYTTTKNENGKIGTYWTPDGRYFVEMVLRRAGFKKNEDNKEALNRILFS